MRIVLKALEKNKQKLGVPLLALLAASAHGREV